MKFGIHSEQYQNNYSKQEEQKFTQVFGELTSEFAAKDFARSSGIERMSLETGTNEAFKPARELYKSLGYNSCDAFGDYVLSEDNMCMTKLI